MKQIFTFCICAIFLFCSCGDNKTPSGWSNTIPVNILVVGDGITPSARNYVGDIGSEKEDALSFVLGGTLTKVMVKNGQQVTKGQLLAEVDATTARSLHATAMATLRQAEDAYRRLEAVHKEGGISDVKWVEMETNLEKARQAEVSARKHLENCSITAPFSGIVSCSDHFVGQDMRPLETFARILDMRQLRVTFSVPEQEIALLSVGDLATATIPALGDREIKLKINDKSLVANPLGHTYKVHAAIVESDTKGIMPDMVAKVNIQLPALDGIVIPTECVQTMPEGLALWVINNGVAQHAFVQVGDFVESGVLITDGLKEGDTVVVSGYQKLYSGAKVSF